MRIRKNKKYLAALLVLALAGTVAAAIYSNSLTGNMELVSQYQIELSWVGDAPYTTAAFMDTPYTGTLQFENLGAEPMNDLYVKVEVTTPTGGTLDMFQVKIGTATLTFTGSSPNFEAVTPSAMGEIPAGGTTTRTFEITFLSAGSPVLGSYTVTIYAWKI